MVYVGFGLMGGLLVFLLWRFFNTPSQVYSTTSPNPNSSPQPGNTTSYPYVQEQQPRLDNSNQPWFNNNRSIIDMSVAMDDTLAAVKTAADYFQAFNDIGQDAGELWTSVSSWFDDGDDSGLITISDYDYSAWA